MSEIQSIANGTYMIGETSDLNFEAGPGISITQQSGGTVRISNDETVLWEGTLAPGSTASLSETFANFECIEVFGYSDDGEAYPWSVKAETGSQSSINLGAITTNDGWAKFLFMTISSGTILSAVNGRALTWGSGAWSNSLSGWRITKVVGINRKENA